MASLGSRVKENNYISTIGLVIRMIITNTKMGIMYYHNYIQLLQILVSLNTTLLSVNLVVCDEWHDWIVWLQPAQLSDWEKMMMSRDTIRHFHEIHRHVYIKFSHFSSLSSLDNVTWKYLVDLFLLLPFYLVRWF